jgi:hypothetical protein
MKGARPHFQIIGLVDNAALLCPKVMQRENEILEGHNRPYEVVEALGERPERGKKLTGRRGSCQATIPL